MLWYIYICIWGRWGAGQCAIDAGLHTVHVAVSIMISSRTRDARTRDIYTRWLNGSAADASATQYVIFSIYMRKKCFQRQLSMHGIRPQGHLYAQVTPLSYDTVYVSIQLLLMHRLQFYT